MEFASSGCMPIANAAVRYGQRHITKKMLRAVPWIGGVVAVVGLAAAMRRKGAFRGALDTALDMTPYLGTLKNVAEAARGRDFIQPRLTAQPKSASDYR